MHFGQQRWEGGVVTLVTLFLVLLGSEYPRQARVGRQREKAPSWHTVLGHKSIDRRQEVRPQTVACSK